MSNRVEELEATVSELESTVRGLTEELVETKERLRALEQEFDVDAADYVDEPTDPEPAFNEADPDEVREAASEADAGGEPEADHSDEEAEEGNEESELGDDIIVA